MKSKLPISLLIPTMNRPKALKRTLESYMQAEYLPMQLVVVDQSDDDVVASEVKQLVEFYDECTKVLYIHRAVPSLTGARNVALSVASENILVWSDDDVDVYSDTLSNIYKLMQNEEIVLIAGLDDNSKITESRVGYFLGTKSYKYRKIGHVTKSILGRYPNGAIMNQIDTMWAMGYFFVTRKEIHQEYGLCWDEKLTGYAYPEDLDFSYRYYQKAIQAQKRCIIDPSIHVVHRTSNEYRIMPEKYTNIYVINRWYLSYKWGLGFEARVMMMWCDFWKMCQRIIQKQHPEVMFESIMYAYKHRKELKRGIITYPFQTRNQDD